VIEEELEWMQMFTLVKERTIGKPPKDGYTRISIGKGMVDLYEVGREVTSPGKP